MINQLKNGCTPEGRLFIYLSKKANLSDNFAIHIAPNLHSQSHADRFLCESENGVLLTAYWIDSGYGYAEEEVYDKEGLPQVVIKKIFPSGFIMLDEDGFFNGTSTKLRYRFSEDAVFVPFTAANFIELAKEAPEANELATKILAEHHNFEKQISEVMRLDKQMRRERILEIFGYEITQVFAGQELAGYLNMTKSHFSRTKKSALSKKSKAKKRAELLS